MGTEDWEDGGLGDGGLGGRGDGVTGDEAGKASFHSG